MVVQVGGATFGSAKTESTEVKRNVTRLQTGETFYTLLDFFVQVIYK